MKKQLFKRLLRSATVVLACMAIFVNLFLDETASTYHDKESQTNTLE